MSLASVSRLTCMLTLSALATLTSALGQENSGESYMRKADSHRLNSVCRTDGTRIVNLSRCKEAARLYEKAIEAGIEGDEVFISLVGVYSDLSEHDGQGTHMMLKAFNEEWRVKMMETLEVGLGQYPESVGLHLLLREYTSDPVEMHAINRKLRELDPDRDEWLKADAEELIGEGRIREGVDKFVEYVDAHYSGDITQIGEFGGQAHALAAQGHAGESLRIYDAIMNLSRRPEIPGWPWRRGRENRDKLCSFLGGSFLESYTEFPEFVERVKRFRLFCTELEHLGRGSRAHRLGDLELAVEELELQLEENPYPPRTYIYLTQVYAGLGQTVKAGEVVKRYFDFEKDVIFRCVYYEKMLDEQVLQYAPDLMRELGEECAKWRQAEGKD